MKKIIVCCALAALFAVTAEAQRRGKGPVGADGGAAVAKGRDAKVTIDIKPKAGGTCLVGTPSFQYNTGSGGQLLPPIAKKPRRWGVFEMKFTTYAKWQDELTVTWYVMLDYTKAKEKDPKAEVAKYSFYNLQTRYVNLPQGSHMACACLDPSTIERYGEPCTVVAIISNKEGDQLAIDGEDTAGLPDKWWENDKVMSALDKKTKKPLIERRAGLVDRSKTPFALINSADYELVQ